VVKATFVDTGNFAQVIHADCSGTIAGKLDRRIFEQFDFCALEFNHQSTTVDLE
tara:strand:- start:341 stop:502 length:162 start_codon:yes stop_codon:yes gene_type:complete